MRLLLAALLLLSIRVQAAPDLLCVQGDKVREIAKTVPHPDDWRFLVVNEIQWQHMLDRNGINPAEHGSAVSNLKDHFTFIRSEFIFRNSDATIRQTLAHEMGHRLCGCADEMKANYYRDKILKGEL